MPLPRKYREPVVLCYLEGLMLEAAAVRLGCPIGTVGVRLMRARERLKDRLTRRGISRADRLAPRRPDGRNGDRQGCPLRWCNPRSSRRSGSQSAGRSRWPRHSSLMAFTSDSR